MIQCRCVIAFLNIESEWQHYKRQLSGNAPVETRARYRGDHIQAMHYNAHNGRFITGAISRNAMSAARKWFSWAADGAGMTVVYNDRRHRKYLIVGGVLSGRVPPCWREWKART